MPPLGVVAAATLALGAVFGLMEATQAHWRAGLIGRPMSWAENLRQSMPSWLLFGIVTPLPVLLTERFRLDRGPRWRAALAHVIGAAVFAVVHQFGLAVFFAANDASGNTSVIRMLTKLLTLNFAIDVVIYCALVGVFHALQYYREFRARELTASQLQAGLTQARLEALRAQLNPHFLFNTLNAISALALKGDQRGVVQMLSLLSDLLRLSLDGNLAQTITLADEIAFIDRYLELQRIRFSDRLAIHKAIDPDTLAALVPSLLLQPVVENAVLHGVAPQRGPGRIDIRASRHDGQLRLEVCDTGPGFDAPDLIEANEGVGLRNTRARLHHLYGEAQSLTCRNLEQGGASVAIHIPFTV